MLARIQTPPHAKSQFSGPTDSEWPAGTLDAGIELSRLRPNERIARVKL